MLNRLRVTFAKGSTEMALDHTATEGEMLRSLLRKVDHLIEKEGLNEQSPSSVDSKLVAKVEAVKVKDGVGTELQTHTVDGD